MKGNYETVEALVDDLRTMEANSADYVVDTRDLVMRDDGGSVGIGSVAEEFLPSGYAVGQITDRLHIPRKFWETAGEYPGMRGKIVNQMWQEKPEKRFVRTTNAGMRAYLSDRYRPMDHMLVLGALLPTLSKHNDLEVVSRSIGDARMYLQVTFPRIEAEVVPGDVVRAGVTVSNSEVGAGAVDVRTTVWRLVCSNGMVGESLFRRHHVGSRINMTDEESYDIYKDDTIRAETESLRLRLRDVFAQAVNEAAFDAMVEKLRNATTDKVDDVFETAKNVTKVYGLREDSHKDLAANVIREGNSNRYGFANALTTYAKTLDNQDSQFEVERHGSHLITMSGKEWKGIAA